MKTKYNIKDFEKLIKQDNSSEEFIKFPNNMPNNLKLLYDRNFRKNDFFKKDDGKILKVDYIPKELFASFINKNNIENNNTNQSNKQNLNNLESNNFSTLNHNENNNDSKSLNKNDSNLDFKISQNEINISESYKKSENIINSNIKSDNQTINTNIHLQANISKESNSNKRYNEEIVFNNSNEKNTNLNCNNQNEDKNIKNGINNLISNESSTLNHNLSNYNGLSDNFINSHLNISNTLTNNSNFLSSQNNYLEKIKLRELEKKENFLIELENKRNKNIIDLIEKQKVEFSKRLKDIENMNKNINDKFFVEKDNKNINNQNMNPVQNSQDICYNNKINNIKGNLEKNILNKDVLKSNEVISYFNKIKQENIKNRRNSNRSTNLNYRTSSSFYTKRTKIHSPFISSAITDLNNRNNIRQSETSTNLKKSKSKKLSKSSNKINISKNDITNNSSRLKSIRSNEYNKGSSLKMLNSVKNNTKEESQICYKQSKNSTNKKIKRKNKAYNPKRKEKIQEKYNIYFNCFIPDLYEEQKQKLLNERKIRVSKSSAKIKKLEDYVGPNLYNEKVDIPDFGYICYKANKKINPKYSLNYDNTYQNYKYGTSTKLYTMNNEINTLNINLRSIYNKYENDKNNNENDIFNYHKFNNNRNRNNNFNEIQNCPKTEYNEEKINNIEYNTLYNRAFKQFKYPYYYDYNEQQPINFEDDNWKLS